MRCVIKYINPKKITEDNHLNNNNFYARVCIAIPRIEFKIVAESI